MRRLLAPLLALLLSGCGGAPVEEAPGGPPPLETPTPRPAEAASPTPSAPIATAPAVTSTPEEGLDFAAVRQVAIGGRVFQVEVAVTPAERAQGLMGRLSLPEDAAMLFVFDGEEYRVFWMKDTLIPLDVLFLDADWEVVDVQTMEPQPGVPDALLRRYRSARPARFALEVNAGLAGRYGIGPGMQAEFLSGEPGGGPTPGPG